MRKKILLLLAAVLLALCVPAQKAGALPARLKVAFNQYQAPYHFLDSQGNAAGLHIDMLEHIAKKEGFELEYLPMDSSTQCREAMERGEVDLLLDITQKLGDSMWVTDALSEENLCVIEPIRTQDASAGGANYPGRASTASIQLETITPSISKQLQVKQTLAVSSQELAIQRLISGRADMAVVLKESALYYLTDLGLSDAYIISNNYIGALSFSLMVAQNDYQLLQAMNRQIAALRVSDDYTNIRSQWTARSPEQTSLLWFKRVSVVLVVALVIIGLYAVIVSRVRRTLRIQVDKQTSALQKANKEIRSHLEQLEAESDMRNRIIRYSSLAMVLFDRKGKVLLINNSATALLRHWKQEGEKQETVWQMPLFRQILAKHDMPALFGQNLSDAEGVHTFMARNDSKERRYRYSLQRILKAEKVWAVLLVVEDITDEEARRNAQFEAEKTRSLTQVVAGVAHEIKNPLTSIKTFVEVMRNNNSDPKFLEDFICYVPAEVERINRLVESLISYAKPARSIKEPMDLSLAVQESFFFAQNSSQSRRIRVTGQIQSGISIIGNRDQIKQILINIIINGRESMEEKLHALPQDAQLELRITLQATETGCRICIRDEGMGMTEEAIRQSMDPFFTTKRTGTGLGLTLSRQFARDNGGELHIVSQPGVYTEIQIEFGRTEYEAQNTDR